MWWWTNNRYSIYLLFFFTLYQTTNLASPYVNTTNTLWSLINNIIIIFFRGLSCTAS